MTSLEALMQQADAALWTGFVVFLRCAGAVSVLPGFGEQSVSVRIKLTIAMALTVCVSAARPELALPDPTMPVVVQLAVTETLTGLILGLGLRLFIIAMQTAGAIAAQATSLAQLSGGAFADPLPGIGQILSLGALTLLMITDFPVKALMYLTGSYDLFLPGTLPTADVLSAWGTGRIAASFALAFQLAAPFFIISVIYNITLGAINRAMPQLMVAFVGAPLITWGSLAVLMLAAPVLLTVWAEHVSAFLAQPFGGG